MRTYYCFWKDVGEMEVDKISCQPPCCGSTDTVRARSRSEARAYFEAQAENKSGWEMEARVNAQRSSRKNYGEVY